MEKPSFPPKPWIARRLRELRKSQTALADALGIDKSGVTNMIKGKRGVGLHEVHVLAEFLRWPVADVLLLLGEERLVRDLELGRVPVLGVVERGASRPMSNMPVRYVRSALDLHDHPDLFALELRHAAMPDSHEEWYPDGTIIYCVPLAEPEKQPGRRVIVETPDGPRTIREVGQVELARDGRHRVYLTRNRQQFVTVGPGPNDPKITALVVSATFREE